MIILKGDITNPDNISDLVAKSIEQWRRVDFLINNIGNDVWETFMIYLLRIGCSLKADHVMAKQGTFVMIGGALSQIIKSILFGARIYPLHKTSEAVKYLSEGHARGKVVIKVTEGDLP